MSCIIIAASTAAIWRMCCGGCGGSASFMDRRRSSSAARRPSRIRKELAEALTGAPFELVERNGAPGGEKYVVFYNPPVVNRRSESGADI